MAAYNKAPSLNKGPAQKKRVEAAIAKLTKRPRGARVAWGGPRATASLFQLNLVVGNATGL